MGNRSRYVAVTAAAASAALASARRRARLRRAADGVREAILPSHVVDLPTESRPGADEAHAPGHQHLGSPEVQRTKEPAGKRPWTLLAHGKRHRFLGE